MPFFELFCFVFWKQSLILIMPDSDGYINCMEGSSAKGEYICRHNFYNKWLISWVNKKVPISTDHWDQVKAAKQSQESL
jgi:hypothetical protein